MKAVARKGNGFDSRVPPPLFFEDWRNGSAARWKRVRPSGRESSILSSSAMLVWCDASRKALPYSIVSLTYEGLMTDPYA